MMNCLDSPDKLFSGDIVPFFVIRAPALAMEINQVENLYDVAF